MVFTQSQLLAHEVYLIDRIDNASREKMKHLKCVCFVRPGHESMQAIMDELRDPKYSDYYLCKLKKNGEWGAIIVPNFAFDSNCRTLSDSMSLS